MEKRFLLPLLLLALVLSSGCVQPAQSGPTAQPERVEKYGFSLAPPQSTAWLDWRDIPFGEDLFQAMVEDMEGEPMLILLKSEAGGESGMSVIAVMLADNNSGYTDISQVPKEALGAGNTGTFGFPGGGTIKKIGELNWASMSAEKPETEQPFMSDIAITLCGDKVAAMILMNGVQNLEENRAYFEKLAESGQCRPQ
jgi:hypothetical protein